MNRPITLSALAYVIDDARVTVDHHPSRLYVLPASAISPGTGRTNRRAKQTPALVALWVAFDDRPTHGTTIRGPPPGSGRAVPPGPPKWRLHTLERRLAMGLLAGLAMLVVAAFLLLCVVALASAEPVVLLVLGPLVYVVVLPVWRWLRAPNVDCPDGCVRLAGTVPVRSSTGGPRVVAGMLLRFRQRSLLDALEVRDVPALERHARRKDGLGRVASLLLAVYLLEAGDVERADQRLRPALLRPDVARHPFLRRLHHFNAFFAFTGPAGMEIEMAPGRAMALALASRIALVQGRHEDGVTHAMKLRGVHPLIRSIKAEALLAADDVDGAATMIEPRGRLEPVTAYLCVADAVILRQRGHPLESVHLLDRVVACRGCHAAIRAEAKVQRALSRLASGDATGARADATELARDAPDDPRVGEILSSTGG